MIDEFNRLGIIVFDVFHFAFNKQTAVEYANFTRKENRKVLIDLTSEYYLNPKLQLITQKITPATKVFYRYNRVKKMIDGFITPALKNAGIRITAIPSISKQGGGVDRESLRKIFTAQ